MAFRFRRRIPIIPGVRLNVSKKGVSLSGGMRGASVTAGQHGLHGNVGAPGTGLSYRTRLNHSKAHQRREAQQQRAANKHQGVREITIHFVLQDNGEVRVTDTSGSELSEADQRSIKRNEDAMKLLLVSFDSTLKANLSVGAPFDYHFYSTDSLTLGRCGRIAPDDPYFTSVSEHWGEKLKDALDSLPKYQFE